MIEPAAKATVPNAVSVATRLIITSNPWSAVPPSSKPIPSQWTGITESPYAANARKARPAKPAMPSAGWVSSNAIAHSPRIRRT